METQNKRKVTLVFVYIVVVENQNEFMISVLKAYLRN